MSPGKPRRHTYALCALAALAACNAPPLFTPDVHVQGQETVTIDPIRNQVDVLFLVDNSQSMEPMGAQLRERFGQFVGYFSELARAGKYTDLHVGVVTSDAPDPIAGCGSAKAPGGRLVRLGEAAPAGCQGPTGAHPWLEYVFDADGGHGNLPAGQTPEQTFTCMASVGTTGCGFEHQLESVYQTLHGGAVENQGFLRKDAVLAVVFVTNEDDCSGPAGAELFDAKAPLGYYGSFRCARFGIACGGQPLPYGASGGPLAGCAPSQSPGTTGGLYDVARYVDLFTRRASEGGLKDDPKDVILVGIAPPDAPVEVVLAPNADASQPVYQGCDQLSESAPLCRPVVQRACMNSSQPQFFGDPAVRLGAVLRAAGGRTHSICDADYSGALGDVAERIRTRLGDGCIPRRLADRDDPDCAVADVDAAGHDAPMPRCDRAEGTLPCWRLEAKEACTEASPEGVGVTVDRGGAKPVAGTYVRVQCAVEGAP